jgi:hypothetical protein
MKKLLHHSKLPIVCKPGAKVSIRYYSMSDQKEITFEDWVVSSFHSKGTTLNIMNPVNNEVRKLTRILILSVNNAEIFI